MDIRKFKVGSQELPVSFPFQAFCDLMADMGFNQYLRMYQSPKHQVEVLKTGLYHGHLLSGQIYKMSEKEVMHLAANQTKVLADVFKYYDQKLSEYIELYKTSSEEGGDDEEGEPISGN